jgi:hypothetical protein
VIACVVSLLMPGCKGRGPNAQSPNATATIAPAAAKPAPTNTDDAVNTQTVDIEDSRTEAEGGGAADTPSTTTAAASKRKTGAAAGARKTPTSQSRPPGRTQ